MATDEAVTLLLKTAGIPDVSDRSTREAAAQVIQTLGCLALAITQAGAVIRQGRCEIAEYCTLYSRRRKELLSEKAIQGGEDYRYTVYTTWEVSRQMIEEMSSEAGRDALELLQVFSFFHYEGIPEEIFYRAWCGLQMEERQSDWLLSHQLNMLLRQLIQEWDISPLRAAVSVLQSFSLVHRDQNHLISIHPLVHAWARDRLIASDEDLIWTQATSTIALSVPWTFQTADYRFRRYLVPQVDACQSFRKDGIFFLLQGIREDCLWMASSFALVYSDMGRLQEALQLRERVVEAYRRTLGDEHPNTISSIYHLALSYRPIGRYQEALQLLERSVEANKRTLGDEHRHTLLSIQSLALIYAEVGRPQEAIRLLERLVEANKRTLGDEHPDTLASRHDPAFTYTDSHVGGYQEALLLLKRVVEAEKKTLGDEHPDTLHSMYMLAFTYSNRDIGRYQEALPLFERVVEGRKKTRGDEHPDTLKAIRVLAVTYCHSDLRRYREALPLFERVVEARKKTLGDEHPDTLESIYALVFTYSEAGRRPEALQLLEQVIEAEKRTLGDEDSATVSSIALLTSLKEETFEQLPETDQRLQLPEPEISVGRSKNQKGASHSHLTRLWKKLVQQHRTKERRREDIE
ncbi:MAG: hypothetical protein LQ338_005713 [Usnochroma carphineum]|nr:MAG: hypothetical protein LQ338_005713 [Usnochroma carphineum]